MKKIFTALIGFVLVFCLTFLTLNASVREHPPATAAQAALGSGQIIARKAEAAEAAYFDAGRKKKPEIKQTIFEEPLLTVSRGKPRDRPPMRC